MLENWAWITAAAIGGMIEPRVGWIALTVVGLSMILKSVCAMNGA